MTRPYESHSAAGDGPDAIPARENREWTSNHAINLRLSIPLIVGRFYVTLVAGRERRDATRRARERNKHPLGTLGNVAVLFVVGVIFGLAGFALIQLAGAYVLMRSGAMVI